MSAAEYMALDVPVRALDKGVLGFDLYEHGICGYDGRPLRRRQLEETFCWPNRIRCTDTP
jgi:hypothetical protein